MYITDNKNRFKKKEDKKKKKKGRSSYFNEITSNVKRHMEFWECQFMSFFHYKL